MPTLDYARQPKPKSRLRVACGWILTGLMFLLALPSIVRRMGRF